MRSSAAKPCNPKLAFAPKNQFAFNRLAVVHGRLSTMTIGTGSSHDQPMKASIASMKASRRCPSVCVMTFSLEVSAAKALDNSVKSRPVFPKFIVRGIEQHWKHEFFCTLQLDSIE